MSSSPFNSDRFVFTWLKYFKDSIAPIKFEFIDGVRFYKTNFFPIYINIGKNLTKGFNYSLNPSKIKNNTNVYLIYDIPSYYNIPEISGSKYLKKKVIGQYNGYLTSLNNYNTIDDFYKTNYSASGRNVLRRRYKALTNSFDISFVMYYGNIEKEMYDMLFSKFHELLIKRFKEKQTDYHIISKWDYIKELTYPMIINKEVAFYVIFDDKEPIAIQLCIQHDRKIIGSVPTYDTDYSKFGLGNISTFKLIEWCLDNDMEIFDSSKGDFGIKKQISDTIYRFEYHVLYNPFSIKSKLIAYHIIAFYNLKQYLREKNIQKHYHNIKFRINSVFGKQTINNKGRYEISKENFDIAKSNNISSIDHRQQNFAFLKRMIFDFLYLKKENVNDIQVYKQEDADIYFIVGKLHQQKVFYL